jgi:SAM-dependent methyltransferase
MTSLSDIRCPIDQRLVFHSYAIKGLGDDPMGRWFHCACGCLFNLHTPDPTSVFTDAYRQRYLDRKDGAERYDYYLRTYAPLLEERTYGRRVLDVGACTDDLRAGLEARGWLAQSLDLLPGATFCGDFETYDFGEAQYDALWLGDVLQCFRDPFAALAKCYRLLRPTGMLFLATPDADLVKMGRFAVFGHWDMEENRQFLTLPLLRRALTLASPGSREGGFEVLLALQNCSQRYPSWNVAHVLAQKIAYGR